MAAPQIETITLRVMSPDLIQDLDKVKQFLQGMMDRMAVSYHKYGTIHHNFPNRRRGVDNIQQRVERYLVTENLEFLMDASNYALIEFLVPCLEDAFFEATDSDQSPGAVNVDGSISHGKDN